MAKREKPVDPLLGELERADVAASAGKRCTLSFDKFFRQYPPTPDYLFGQHTRELIKELQLAAATVEAGGKYYGIVSMPPRHGKSDICSRRFPAWFLCRNPDLEVILATYGADLSQDLSHSTRKCFEEVAPRFGLRLSEDRNQIGAWKIEGHRGGMFAIGLGGAITGRGGSMIIIDDYCKNRAEAESEVTRQHIWDSFRSDVITRGAPAHAVIIVATRWHEDDLVGRILEEQKQNPDFPKFKRINFPAQFDGGRWLFPERFSDDYYRAQKSIVGSYAWESLYQGNPTPRTGRFLRTDKVKVVDKLPDGLRFVRAWDLASTEKERVKDDPDFTVGTKMAYHDDIIYVADVQRGQWSAPERDKRIIETAQRDGPSVNVWIEAVAGYKDTYTRMKSLLSGRALVRASRPSGDKVSRASCYEPKFEAAQVSILRADWNAAWLAEFSAFPRGKHDDQVDSFTIAAEHLISSRRRMGMSN
jgi:predicted phage terminase large subunit-like protein